MLFTTLQYGVFFTTVFIVHWILPQILRRPFLVIASLYFYASAVPKYVYLIIGMIIFNYLIGLVIGHTNRKFWRKTLLIFGIVGNLGSLAYFKYTAFIITSLGNWFPHFSMLASVNNDPFFENIILPLGISFFTFEFIHYIVEVYKGLKPMANPIDFSLFAAFFPTQIAGPIKRFPDFAKQLQHPLKLREVNVDYGIGLVIRGMVKKIVIADTLSPFVATTFADPSKLGIASAWVAVFAFAIQIYCDFSGYTDIGRGCAALLGYSVPENFRGPYVSANPSEFWKRWHISLSSWLQDYLYIPLGGSRVAPWHIYINLMITMALGGLWHGASWHFMIWGVYQGLLLCAFRLWDHTLGQKTWYQEFARNPMIDFLKRPLTFGYICIGWVLFRADNMAKAFAMFTSMFLKNKPIWAGTAIYRSSMVGVLLLSAITFIAGSWLWEVGRPFFSEKWDQVSHRFIPNVDMQLTTNVLLRPSLFVFGLFVVLLWPPHVAQTFIYFKF